MLKKLLLFTTFAFWLALPVKLAFAQITDFSPGGGVSTAGTNVWTGNNSWGTTTTAGTATTKISPTMTGTGAEPRSFFTLDGTLPTTLTATSYGAQLNITSAGSSAFVNGALNMLYNAGYTGASPTRGLVMTTTAAGTNATTSGNAAIAGFSNAVTAGTNVGLRANAASSSTTNIGGLLFANASTSSPVLNLALHAGALNATNNVAGYFTLDASTTVPAITSSAIWVNNAAAAVPIVTLADNQVAVVVVQDGGSVWEKQGTKTLTESVATAFVRVAVGSNAVQGGLVEYCVDANDATNYQTRCGTVPFSLVNEGGIEACILGTPSDADGTPTGTLTAAFTGASNAADTCDLLVDATSSLIQTTLRINYYVREFGNVNTSVTAQ